MEEQTYIIEKIARSSNWYKHIDSLRGKKVKVNGDDDTLSRYGPWFSGSFVLQEEVKGSGINISEGTDIYIHTVTLRKV